MMRVVVTPAVLPPSALAELKDWLGITTTQDDAPLAALLAMALDVCADFTGLVPLACECEEMLPLPGDWRLASTDAGWGGFSPPDERRLPVPRPGWRQLASLPVSAVSAVEGVAADGTRTAFDTSRYETRIDAEGGCFLRISDPGGFIRAAVRFTAGVAADWDSLPDPLRHGIIRLAAHQHRTREGDGAAPLPPASVAAIWRPFRHVRLA